jgi:membrane protease YdiL (CAAX protease family)
MEQLRSRHGLTSTVAGIVVAALLFALGGGSGPVGLVLAAMLGGVFAASMYAVMRARGKRSS